MSFLYPLGLLGLIGIPILIIIYIIKNKYTEQVIASTYIWTLSEKFLKKRLPIHRLVGLISLILQLLTVLLVSFAVAHPVFTIANSANDYCFVLDGSGSMNIVQQDKTRLDIAKGEIASVIEGSMEGSSYSLVFVGDTTDKIYDGITDKESALKLLNGITPSYTSPSLTDAIGAAQEYFNDNPSICIYLVTDKSIELKENVTVINVSDGEENYAVSDVTYSVSGISLKVEGNVISYESDKELSLELYIDGAEEKTDSQKINVNKAQAERFTFEVENADFLSLKVVVTNSDALALDNEITVYNVQNENSYSALLVSETPFFIHAALLSVGNAKTYAMSPDDYTKLVAVNDPAKLGYDLYVFDGYTPDVLPQDGAVWFFNPDKDVAESGFAVQDKIDFTEAQKPVYSDDTATIIETLLTNIDVAKGEDIYVAKYVKCGTYRKFNSILLLEGNPLIFTGTNTYGNREVVFAFDLHDSNFPLLSVFIALTDNLLKYTFPAVIDEASYYCGDTMEINVISNCDSIRVESPLGKISYMDTSSAICEYELTEVGSYSIKVMVGNVERVYSVFASMPEEERNPSPVEQSFSVSGEPSFEKRNGFYSDLLYLFILLAVVCIADWMVYCYEQYQLR